MNLDPYGSIYSELGEAEEGSRQSRQSRRRRGSTGNLGPSPSRSTSRRLEAWLKGLFSPRSSNSSTASRRHSRRRNPYHRDPSRRDQDRLGYRHRPRPRGGRHDGSHYRYHRVGRPDMGRYGHYHDERPDESRDESRDESHYGLHGEHDYHSQDDRPDLRFGGWDPWLDYAADNDLIGDRDRYGRPFFRLNDRRLREIEARQQREHRDFARNRKKIAREKYALRLRPGERLDRRDPGQLRKGIDVENLTHEDLEQLEWRGLSPEDVLRGLGEGRSGRHRQHRRHRRHRHRNSLIADSPSVRLDSDPAVDDRPGGIYSRSPSADGQFSRTYDFLEGVLD